MNVIFEDLMGDGTSLEGAIAERPRNLKLALVCVVKMMEDWWSRRQELMPHW